MTLASLSHSLLSLFSSGTTSANASTSNLSSPDSHDDRQNSNDKHAPVNEQEQEQREKSSASVSNGSSTFSLDLNKPREERSFRDIYPFLDTSQQLSVEFTGPPLLISKKQQHHHSHYHYHQSRYSISSAKISSSSLSGITFERKDLPYEKQIPNTLDNALFSTVEYDMDDQDFAWLNTVNAYRRTNSMGVVSAGLFEQIMDCLEKEFHYHLAKPYARSLVQASINASSSSSIADKNENKEGAINVADTISMLNGSNGEVEDDIPCNICGEIESNNVNALVFCDGCDLAVHQECYGVPHIPEGPWLCRPCLLNPERDSIPIRCAFCPILGGAFKQTVDNRWGHLLCAHWIDELYVLNQVYVEPIDGIANVPKQRWKMECSICNQKVGACVQCSARNCRISYHITCAINADFLIDDANHRSYCAKHTSEIEAFLKDHLRSKTVSSRNLEKALKSLPQCMPTLKNYPRWRKPVHLSPQRKFSKSKAIPQVIPKIVVDKLMNGILKNERLKSKREFLEAVCRFWSLKRESKGSIPLIRRLRLDPVVPSTKFKPDDEGDEQKIIEDSHERFIDFYTNLSQIRALSALVLNRELAKLEKTRLQSAIFSKWTLPFGRFLDPFLSQLQALDTNLYFRDPETYETAPDYRRYISKPMSFEEMRERLFAYATVDEFEADFNLICDNAMTYNLPDSLFYKAAKKMKAGGQIILKALRNAVAEIDIRGEDTVAEGVNIDARSVFAYSIDKVTESNYEVQSNLVPRKEKKRKAVVLQKETMNEEKTSPTVKKQKTKNMISMKFSKHFSNQVLVGSSSPQPSRSSSRRATPVPSQISSRRHSPEGFVDETSGNDKDTKARKQPTMKSAIHKNSPEKEKIMATFQQSSRPKLYDGNAVIPTNVKLSQENEAKIIRRSASLSKFNGKTKKPSKSGDIKDEKPVPPIEVPLVWFRTKIHSWRPAAVLGTKGKGLSLEYHLLDCDPSGIPVRQWISSDDIMDLQDFSKELQSLVATDKSETTIRRVTQRYEALLKVVARMKSGGGAKLEKNSKGEKNQRK